MKRAFKTALAVACTTTVLSTSAIAEEFRLNRLFVVGDSLSDGGAYSQTTQFLYANDLVQDVQGNPLPQLPNTVPGINYRFVDNAPDGSSRVYAEVLAAELGLPLGADVINDVPAAAGTPLGVERNVNGGNYAQGGSRVALQPGVSNNDLIGVTTIPVSAQVTNLINDVGQFNANDLIIVWGGANDVFTQSGAVAMGLPQAQAGANMAAAGAAQLEQIRRLRARGATNIVVVTVPRIGTNTPFGQLSELQQPGAIAGLDGLTGAFNQTVAGGQAELGFAIVDADRLLSAVLADPARYGFTPNSGNPAGFNQVTSFECFVSSVQCIQGVTTVSDGNARVFADGVHPTSQAHAIFGQAAHAGLIAATQNGVIPVSTLAAIRQQSLGLENRLTLASFYERDETGNRVKRQSGHVEIYGGAEAGFYSSDAEQIRPGLDARTQVIKVAADVMVTPKLLLGAGISLDHGQVDFDQDRGNIDSRLVIGGIFGVAEIIKGVYVNATLGYGVIDVYDINRSFSLGPSRESYDADTSGEYFVAKGGVGAVLPLGGGFAINPSVGFAFEKVDIDGYTESNGGASLAYGDTGFESQRLTVALAGFYNPPGAETWTLGLRASLEHDFNDDDVEVTFGPDSNRLATIGAPRPDGTFGYLSATIAKDITPSSSIAFQASTVLGLDGVDGYTGSLVYKLAF